MSNLICMSHPKYNGKDSPVLSCKTCCSIFIQLIKIENTAHMDEQEKKRRKVIKRRAENAKMAQGGLSPEMI